MQARRSFLGWLIKLPGVALVGGALSTGASACELDDASGDPSGADATPDATAPDVGDGGLRGADADSTADADTEPPDAEAGSPIDAARDEAGPPDASADDAARDDGGPPDAGDGAGPDGGDAAAEVDDGEGTSCEPTEDDLQGPFYEPDAPSEASLAPAGEPGTPLAMSGTVYGPDCTTPLAGATVEVWQADDAGDYHDGKLRATLAADGEGTYAFETIRPGSYSQPSGPRPAHIHYKVSAPGHETLVTQLYFEGDPALAPNDSCGVCRSDDEGRIIPLAEGAGGDLTGVFDIVLAASA